MLKATPCDSTVGCCCIFFWDPSLIQKKGVVQDVAIVVLVFIKKIIYMFLNR